MRRGLILIGLLVAGFSSKSQNFENKNFYSTEIEMNFYESSLTAEDQQIGNTLSGTNPLNPNEKRIVRKFAIDSPFGTLMGPGNPSQEELSTYRDTNATRKDYRLLLCFTGVGLRIDL